MAFSMPSKLGTFLMVMSLICPAAAHHSEAFAQLGSLELTSTSAEDMPSDEIEAALAAEQARQDAMLKTQEEIGPAFAAFQDAYERALQNREALAVAAIDMFVISDGCNLGSIERFVGNTRAFVHSRALIASMEDIKALREDLVQRGQKVDNLPTGSPPDPSGDVAELVRQAGHEIAAIAGQFANLCAEVERKMAMIPATDGAKMMEVTSSFREEETALSLMVQQIVVTMNDRIDTADLPLANWLREPLMRPTSPR